MLCKLLRQIEILWAILKMLKDGSGGKGWPVIA
jgi:hypothetical protein